MQQFVIEDGQSFRDQLLQALRGAKRDSLWFVEREGVFVSIMPGRNAEFTEWERRHVGFRRYSLYGASWSKHDEHKFSLIERTPRVSFFVRVGEGEVAIHPERHLCM